MFWMKAKKLAAVATVSALMVSTAACGSDDDKASKGGLQEITVGILPTVDLAPLTYAIDSGIFTKHGLKVKTRVTSGGSEAIPALLAGDVDFIFSSYIPLLLARQTGLDVTIASGSHSNTPSEASPSGLWVKAESKVNTLADLKGKTIAVNALGSFAELAVVASMDDLGIKRSDYKLLEIPFPDVPSALDQGKVDAAWVAEPTRTKIIKDLNARFVGSAEDPKVMSTNKDLQNLPVAGYGARGNEDAEVLKSFHAAMSEALEALAADPDIARQKAPEGTKIAADLLPDLAVSTFGQVSTDDIKRLQDLMITYGMLDGPVKGIDKLVYTP